MTDHVTIQNSQVTIHQSNAGGGAIPMLHEFRAEFNELHEEAKRQLARDAMLIPCAMSLLYRQLETPERELANLAIGEWLMSEDDGDRHDAQWLVREFRIRSCESSLRQLAAARLAQTGTPDARFELDKVNDILSELGES